MPNKRIVLDDSRHVEFLHPRFPLVLEYSLNIDKYSTCQCQLSHHCCVHCGIHVHPLLTFQCLLPGPSGRLLSTWVGSGVCGCDLSGTPSSTRSILVAEPNLGYRRHFVWDTFIALALDFGGNGGWWTTFRRCQQPWTSWSRSAGAPMAFKMVGSQGEFSRGVDSGLAKAAPSAVGLTQSTYRSYRRRLDLFRRQCKRRGQGVALEGTFCPFPTTTCGLGSN